MTGTTNALPPSTTLSHRLLTLILLTSLLAINTLAFAGRQLGNITFRRVRWPMRSTTWQNTAIYR
ncbi:MAG: hypothetical protein IPN42_01305 [Methylococcaceae bacterium]|nr:hypothetical protein [Methylococcaceae bacterium]